MNKSIRRPNAFLAVLLVTAAAPLLAAAPAFAVHFERESLKSYQAQLHKGEVHALTFHAGTGGATTGHLHISLNNGEHMSVTYATREQGKLVAQAQAANARVKVATATSKKAAPAKHKLRYIAGAILIVVIVIVLIVLLIGRRRAVAGDGTPQAPSGESAA